MIGMVARRSRVRENVSQRLSAPRKGVNPQHLYLHSADDAPQLHLSFVVVRFRLIGCEGCVVTGPLAPSFRVVLSLPLLATFSGSA